MRLNAPPARGGYEDCARPAPLVGAGRRTRPRPRSGSGSDRGVGRPTVSNRMPHVLLHCHQDKDRRQVGELLEELGAEYSPLDALPDLEGALSDDAIDLALAHVDSDVALLEELLRRLEAHRHGHELPLIVLAEPDTLDGLAERTAERFHVVLLAKPFGKCELVA